MEQGIDTNETESLESQQSQEIEAEASRMGWSPKEKFRGAPEKWVDAKTFVERGREVLPIVKSELRKTREELAEVRQAAQEFQALTQAAKEREVSEWKAKYQEAIRAKKEALDQGDGEKFIEAEATQKELEATRPKPKEEVKEDPAFAAWRRENDWYGSDMEMTMEANLIGFRLAKKGLRGRELYDAVKDELDGKARETEGMHRAGAQRGGRTAASTKGARTYANLKPEFKDACDRMVKRLSIKAEDYVSKAPEEAFN